jgi:hypothetical protein
MSAYCDGDSYRPSTVFDVVRPAATAAVSMPTSKTAKDIRGIMDALDRDAVARHLDNATNAYVVCDGVSVDAFNKYIGGGEGLQIGLRFLDLCDDGRIAIVDLPTRVHESTSSYFESEFLSATGNGREVGRAGSMTARRVRFQNKEADVAFGPLRTTLNRTPPPPLRIVSEWVTLAVEVGRTQPWTSLERAAEWWCTYSGIQYILLLKISRTGIQMEYALYDIAIRGTLPVPIAHDKIYRNNTGQPVYVSFDMRRILSIPRNAALPPGVNVTALVDLRLVMDLVIKNL